MFRPRRACRGSLLALAVAACAPASVRAQADSVTVVAGAQYAAGTWGTRLMGSGYRVLWTTPIRVEVLDLKHFAKGLRPLERGGGNQSITLHLQGEDGRRYVFRPVDKEMQGGVGERASTLPHSVRELMHGTLSALHPASTVIAPALQCAVGIPCAPTRLVVMPDDPALGEHRATFAGILGTIEERPDDGDGAETFGGFSRIVGSDRLIERLNEKPAERVDARAYLEARLFDLVLGDWDRHTDQWRWGAREEGGRITWVPIPRDRDYAFVHYSGIVASAVRTVRSRKVRFDAEIRDLNGLLFSSTPMDHLLLAELPWEAWDSVTVDLQRRLGDDVIAAAVRKAPPEYHAIAGESLVRRLATRRDHLLRASRRFYELLSTEVDVHGTQADDAAVVRRLDERRVEVRLFAAGENGTAKTPSFHRVFDRSETREVRVYLDGGDDVGRVEGVADGPVVRLVGGTGDDRLVDSTDHAPHGKPSSLHDAEGEDVLSAGSGVLVDRRPFTPPDGSGLSGVHHRDWGSSVSVVPTVDLESGAGLILGGGVDFQSYGFRGVPDASRIEVRGVYALEADGFAAEVRGISRAVDGVKELRVRARATWVEPFHYYGLGNETPRVDEDDALNFERQLILEPELRVLLAGTSLSLGVLVQHTDPGLEPGTPLETGRPYGSGPLGKVGLRASLEADRRDDPVATGSGVFLAFGGEAYPAAWTTEDAYARARADARAWLPLPLPLRPTLVLRAGVEHAWGRYPVQDAAFLGGSRTLHGYAFRRFAGDAMAHGGIGLRAPLLELGSLLPGSLGVHVLAEAGRVFLDGESSNRWHGAVGGGVWARTRVAGRWLAPSVTYAHGEIDRVYLGFEVPY